ncbi:MAG: nicotinamide mononucleotide transporter, partial [Bacteroidales bacterium]|nr:nicotinamide mononucleotide transporter [Bacteroidales bacterium]
MELILDWLVNNWFELVGAIFGIIAIILQIKRKVSYWPVVIIAALFYVFIYYNARIYAYMSFQFYYLGVSIFGWYYWVKHKNTKEKGEAANDINRLDLKTFIILMIISAVLFVVFYLVLSKFTNTDIPYGDAFITAISCVATWLLAKKYLENWLFWIVTDSLAVVLYFHKALYPTVILYVLYLILAVVG